MLIFTQENIDFFVFLGNMQTQLYSQAQWLAERLHLLKRRERPMIVRMIVAPEPRLPIAMVVGVAIPLSRVALAFVAAIVLADAA